MRITAFLAAGAVVLALAVSGVFAAPEGQASGDDPAVATDLPDVDDQRPPTADGVATVDGERYDSVQAAVDAAPPGATVHLAGRFRERVVVRTPNVTLAAASQTAAVVDGGGTGDVLAVEAPGVTVERVWLRNSGRSADGEDAGVVVNASDATLRSVRLTEVTFGIWVDGVDGVTIENCTVVGREGVESHAERGNGIHLWNTAADVEVRDNDVTRVRDGIYFSWAEGVDARGNRLWDLRYGVHYMYANENALVDNLAVGNDVGYALMVSEDLRVEDNVAARNRGESGYGIMVKDIEDTTVAGNVLVDNDVGAFESNAQANALTGNLLLANDVGVHATAGTSGQTVAGNSFVHNDLQAFTTRDDVVAWNGSGAGNYWSDARAVDRTGDGVGDVRHRPAGAVERLVHEEPAAGVFADSPAFTAIRLAEDSFPVVESPGIVDHRPLATSPHDWRTYYAEGGATDGTDVDEPESDRNDGEPESDRNDGEPGSDRNDGEPRSGSNGERAADADGWRATATHGGT